ncbi:hypothetical protein M3Y99_01858300 [Aphelenchoides fujianensis]|nr:hypothetical protein M3Y99_01858300 [Aphelenchoides fujianensis]
MKKTLNVTKELLETADSFAKMPVKAPLQRALLEAGFESPTPLQTVAIPVLARGDSALMTAEERSGRTVAIAVGILERIDDASDRVQALILAPTRQSVQKMAETMQKLASHTSVRVHSCAGGTLSVDDERRLLAERKPHVIVGLPGRVNVLLGRDAFAADHVRSVVLYHANEPAWQTLQDQTTAIFNRIPSTGQVVADRLEGHAYWFKQLFDHPTPSFFVIAKDEENGAYTVVRAEDHVSAQRARAQTKASGAAASSSAQMPAEDPDFALISNWNRPAASWDQGRISAVALRIFETAGFERPRPNTLQEQLLTPAFDGMDVVGITPPERGTAFALALVATERVNPRTAGLQVLVVEPWPPSDIEELACAFGLPNFVAVDRCECHSDDECDHPLDGHQILVHSPTASCRTTVAERCMESSELKLVVLHRVDALLAADRPKIFALIRAKPPHVQLVITAVEMTADVLRIARDFMPPRTVKGDRSPAVISMAATGLQVASYSLVNGHFESKVHVNARELDETLTTMIGQRMASMWRVPTEPRDLSRLPPFDLQRCVRAQVVRGMREAGVWELRDEQKAHLLACATDLPNTFIRGPPGSGKSTTAALVVLRAAEPSIPVVHVVVFVPNAQRAQKFKSMLETLGKYAKPSIYVCEQPTASFSFPSPSIVIGKPRQIRRLITDQLITPANLELVVFAQVHEMLGAAYREDPREVLRSLPVFVPLLATSNSGDAAVVREIDEFFNGDLRVRDERMAATAALGEFADYRLRATIAGIAHATLKGIVKELDDSRAHDTKNGKETPREAQKPKGEAYREAATKNDAKDGAKKELKSSDGPSTSLDAPTDNEMPPNPNGIDRSRNEPPTEAAAKKTDEQPKAKGEEKAEASGRVHNEAKRSSSPPAAEHTKTLHCLTPFVLERCDVQLQAEVPEHPVVDRPATTKGPPRASRSLLQYAVSFPEERSQEEWDRTHGCFADFGLKIPLVLALFQSGLSIPRPLQQRALPALLEGRNLVIEGPPGAGKTTAVMIALLNQLDPENDGLQALCLARTGEEVVRLRDQMEEIASKLRLRVGACEEDPVDKQLRLNRRDAHVFIGTNVHIDSCYIPGVINFSAVTHFVAFERGTEPESRGIGFVGGAGLFQDLLRIEKRPIQTILVTERVTDEVLDVCKRMKVDFSLISTIDTNEEAHENSAESSGSQSRQTSQDSADSSDFVHVELLPASSTSSAPQQPLSTASTTPIDPAASTVSSPARDKARGLAKGRNTFAQFGLRRELLAALKEMRMVATLLIQRRAIPRILAGRNAVVRAPAGSGTLGVYLLPLLHRLDTAVGRLQAIIVCQKRSTAAEIEDALWNGYGRCLDFKMRVCLGGELVAEQLQAIGEGAQVVIGTVQRVQAILEAPEFDIRSLQFVVFDEIERCGREMVHSILRRLPANVQVVLMAREESEGVDQTAREFLSDPLFISKEGEANTVFVLPKASSPSPPVEELQPSPSTAPIVSSAASSTRSSSILRCSFDKFGLRRELRVALKRMEIPGTVAIQRRAIPPILAGRNAVVRAPAGLGTLGAYLLPLLQRLDTSVDRVQAIVVCEKQSTAEKIEDALVNGYGQCMRFNAHVCREDELLADQLRTIGNGVQVLIGTLQRIQSIVAAPQFDKQSLNFVVFDEVEEQLRARCVTVHVLLRRLSANVQLVFMARGESEAVDQTAREFLKDPLFVSKEGEADESKAVDRKDEGEASGQLPTEQEERESSTKASSEQSTSLSTSSSSDQALVEVDSRRPTARVPDENDDEQQGAVVEKEAEEERTSRQAIDVDDASAPVRREFLPAETIAHRLAAARLRGQLLENRLTELRIYELEEQLGLAHGQALDVLPPN